MVHPASCGCKPLYKWRQSGGYRVRTVEWYHCRANPPDVRTDQRWDGQRWIHTVICRTCGSKWEG
jgi:hypothetical protein